MNYDSDVEILGSTVRNGTVWSMPQHNLLVDVTGMTAFAAAETWCKMVRHAKKQEEEAIEREAQQAAQRRRQEDLLRGSDNGPDKGAGEPVGDGEPDRSDIPYDEISLEEILYRKLNKLKYALKDANQSFHEADALKYEFGKKIALIQEEIVAVESAMEVACGTRQDNDEVGLDIHIEVSGEGQTGGGDVGNKDSPTAVSQDAGEEGEGDSEGSRASN